MPKNLISSHLYKILFLFFVLFFTSRYLSIHYLSIIIIIITYLISNILKLKLDRNVSLKHLGSYLLFLFKEIFTSTIHVSYIIWSRNYKISPKFEWIETENKTDLGITIFANSISLTPGTVTVDINDNKLLIHSLEESGIDGIKESKMDAKVKEIIL
jgi:multicomponent Na+:H+ antiporter subunit E